MVSKRNHWYSQSNKAIFLRIDKLRLALQMETKREPFLFIARNLQDCKFETIAIPDPAVLSDEIFSWKIVLSNYSYYRLLCLQLYVESNLVVSKK
jgi:hypothetical protein